MDAAVADHSDAALSSTAARRRAGCRPLIMMWVREHEDGSSLVAKWMLLAELYADRRVEGKAAGWRQRRRADTGQGRPRVDSWRTVVGQPGVALLREQAALGGGEGDLSFPLKVFLLLTCFYCKSPPVAVGGTTLPPAPVLPPCSRASIAVEPHCVAQGHARRPLHPNP